MNKLLTLAVVVCALTAVSAPDSSVAVKSYQIRNCKYGGLLRPRDANNGYGTRIVLYPAEPWKCMTWKLHPAGDSAFQLQNHFTHKTFQVDKNEAGAAVVQVPFDADPAKRPAWKFEKLADGFYRIRDIGSGKCLAASSAKVVILAPRDEKQEQEWELIETDPAKLTM
jgi:hypothetical protein